jgi:hypothetical protein
MRSRFRNMWYKRIIALHVHSRSIFLCNKDTIGEFHLLSPHDKWRSWVHVRNFHGRELVKTIEKIIRSVFQRDLCSDVYQLALWLKALRTRCTAS